MAVKAIYSIPLH